MVCARASVATNSEATATTPVEAMPQRTQPGTLRTAGGFSKSEYCCSMTASLRVAASHRRATAPGATTWARRDDVDDTSRPLYGSEV